MQDTRKAFRRIPPARLSLLMAVLLLLALGATALVFAARGQTESVIVAGTPEKPASADKDILRRLEQGDFLTAAKKTVRNKEK